ncbi:MAG TPA: 4-hydroxythreonine-4-phosphate dehydrogenase PdxA [Candidatus Gastranaerophilaceae bacterium]|nr:4-hydroxythreonine-4-phosphate dehydrogenase PdxA [Candidatus Gastranaerophilaceae bacterium]HPT41059.1 4-hydroxythreonine-4-phosphate dehydrogenase PdxA [Candidatus Gastranaerophilaceae bacterium]
MNKQKKIAITTGDANGIGAEITIKALNKLDLPIENVVLISNSKILNFYGKLKKKYPVIEIDFDMKNLLAGKPTAQSGDFAFRALKKACQMVKNKQIDAIVTAPVSKETMHLAGHKFSGQTEVLQKFLAQKGQSAQMLFVAEDFRVLLLTRHLPLREVSIDKKDFIKKIKILDEFFKSKLKIRAPKFGLCAFNPHAGEGGILGREEIEILLPAVKALRKQGVDITEPLPADTLFVKAAKAYLNRKKNPYDCYIANYHDQGLIPIKALAFEKTVNMTIGLDVIRTSPSHGTAFDIAGKNLADESSMTEAIKQALI